MLARHTIASVLLVVVFAACAEEADRRGSKAASANGPAHDTSGSDEGSGFRVSGPYRHDGLALYLIHAADRMDTVELQTLEEALASDTAVVHETGQVSELALEVTGERAVYVQSGDIVKGGRQDRVVAYDLIVRRSDGRVPLSSFCVEQGRWSGRGNEPSESFAGSAFLASDATIKTRIRGGGSRVRRVTGRAGRSSTATPEAVDLDLPRDEQRAVGAGGGFNLFAAEERNADPQGQVWQRVSEQQDALREETGVDVQAGESKSSLQLTLEHEQVEARRRPYRTALGELVDAHPDAVGMVYAIDGEIVFGDRYPSHDLLARMWDKLLTSCSTEALASGGDGSAPPSAGAVAEWLDQMEAQAGRAEQIHGAISQESATGEAGHRFDAVDARLETPWFHRAYARPQD